MNTAIDVEFRSRNVTGFSPDKPAMHLFESRRRVSIMRYMIRFMRTWTERNISYRGCSSFRQGYVLDFTKHALERGSGVCIMVSRGCMETPVRGESEPHNTRTLLNGVLRIDYRVLPFDSLSPSLSAVSSTQCLRWTKQQT